MHTVRNRLASRPPANSGFAAGKMPPGRSETGYVPRGSMAIPLVVAEESGLIETRAQRRRNPKGKKARKAAARLAALREAEGVTPLAVAAEPPEAPLAAPRIARKGKPKGQMKGQRKGRPQDQGHTDTRATRAAAVQPEQLPALPVRPIAVRQVVVASDPVPAPRKAAPPALTLPERAEPLVVTDAPRMPLLAETHELAAAARPLAEAQPAETPQAVLPLPAFPLPEEAPLVDAPPAPEPAVVPEPERATALAALVDAPLPRARALVPARRQGLVDVIAFLLRDSGRRLARWSARRHKTREEQAALRRAEARQLNLQRELDALDALRRHKGQEPIPPSA